MMPTSCRWRPSRLPAVVPPLWQLVGPRCASPPSPPFSPPPPPPRPPPHLPAAPAGEVDHFLPRVSTLLMSALLKVTATLKTVSMGDRRRPDIFTLSSFFSSFCCRSADFMPYVFRVFPVSIVAGCHKSQTSSITGHFVRPSVENMFSSEINYSFSLSDPSNVSTIQQKMFSYF